MSFLSRAAIALLSGIGAGLLGFWAVWRTMIGTTFDSIPGPGYDAYLVAGSFVPGVVAAALVFRTISRATRAQPA